MPINAGHEYFTAEGKYLAAQTLEEKIYWLEEMIKKAPKHKSSENFVAELKTRLKKFREKAEKASKKSGGKKGVRKEGFQFVLVGKTNSGKSLLLSKLTNAFPIVSEFKFTTRFPNLGTFIYEGVRAQVVDLPSIGCDEFDIGLANTADCLLIVVENLEDFIDIEKLLERAVGKKLVVVNKGDRFGEGELRKFEARIKSKKINAIIVSALTGMGIINLKEMMFQNMGVIRVYTKEPGKRASEDPVVLPTGANVRNVAESIRKGFALTVKETRLTGPSGKFSNQKVGLGHRLKDRDIVEFHTR